MTTVLDTTRGDQTRRDRNAATTAKRLARSKPVSVNGVTIARAEISREAQHHPATRPLGAWMAAARALVIRELLLQEARRLSIVPEPATDTRGRRETEDEAITRQLIEREVTTPDADEATCRRVYQQQRSRFRSSDVYAVRHILIAALPGAAEARDKARLQAQKIVAQLRSDLSLFAQLAETMSACPSRAHCGALGQISRGQTVPEFESALRDAPIGDVVPEPIETRYGFHVVIVDHRIEGRQLPFEIVQERIADWLTARAHETAVRQFISMLAGRATITGVDLEAGAGPLEQ